MLTQIINGHILTPGGWLKDGSILLCDDRIVEVTNSDLAVIGAKVVDARGMYIVPGFVAMNIHGAAGHDFKEGTEEAFRKAVAAHQRYGATTIFPTISSSPFTTIRQCAEVCERLMTEPGSPILGLHLEGPYLNPKMAGAMFSDVVKNPDPEEYRSLIEETKCVRRWDASPELPGAMDFARYLKEKGILVSITHTEAEFDLIREAYNTGFSHVAHFYNAMPGFHKRREYKYEGTVESAYLMDGITVEVAYAANDGKQPDDSRIVIDNGVCKLADHSALVGSIATSDQLIRTMVEKAKLPLEDAIRMASETPARLMGVYDRVGSLQKGKDADVLIIDRKLNVRQVWCKGQVVVDAAF